jgi:hypothetical protein
MASKNPTNEIASNILLDGGYDPCTKFPPNATFWTNKSECDPGFISDNSSGYCYMLLPNSKSLKAGDEYCKNNYDAELISFDTKSDVDGFFTLIINGKGKY